MLFTVYSLSNKAIHLNISKLKVSVTVTERSIGFAGSAGCAGCLAIGDAIACALAVARRSGTGWTCVAAGYSQPARMSWHDVTAARPARR